MAKKRKKSKHQPPQPQTRGCDMQTPRGPAVGSLPYPFDDFFTRPVTDLSAQQALSIVAGIFKPTTALVGVLTDLCQASGKETMLFPDDIGEVLTLVSAHLYEAERFCTRWRAAHTTEWP